VTTELAVEPHLLESTLLHHQAIEVWPAGRTLFYEGEEPRGVYVHPGSPLLVGFGEADADFVLYGHTHQQLVERIGRVLVINPGSAGDARDPRNNGQLSCAVLDTASEEVTILEFPDPQRAAP